MMDIPMALVLLVTAGLVTAGALWWLARHDQRALVAFIVAFVPGVLAGAFILDQANQPGLASLNGALAAAALGALILVILIVALLVRRVRTPAAAVAISLVLSAVMASQLLVYLDRR